MPFYDSFLVETSFVDCVTPTNFVLYILLREYISSVMIDSSLSQDLVETKKDKVAIYMFFYKRLRVCFFELLPHVFYQRIFRCRHSIASTIRLHLFQQDCRLWSVVGRCSISSQNGVEWNVCGMFLKS